MKNNPLYRLLTASLLMILFLSALSIREAHHYFGHEDHPVCELELPGQQHIHGEEYMGHNCQICSIPYLQLPHKELSFQNDIPPLYIDKTIFPAENLIFAEMLLSYSLRGPPHNCS